jgi:hypothetical protein
MSHSLLNLSPISRLCVCLVLMLSCKTSVQMEPKDQTPQQMLGRSFGSNRTERSNLRLPDTGVSRMPRSPLSPELEELEFVKQTQIQAQEQRVTAWVKELMEGRNSTPVDSRRADDQVDALTRSDAVGSSSGGTMLDTAIRKNITQRRSRGRIKDDGQTAPRASLLARRSRSRSKDKRYSIEGQALFSVPPVVE